MFKGSYPSRRGYCSHPPPVCFLPHAKGPNPPRKPRALPVLSKTRHGAVRTGETCEERWEVPCRQTTVKHGGFPFDFPVNQPFKKVPPKNKHTHTHTCCVDFLLGWARSLALRHSHSRPLSAATPGLKRVCLKHNYPCVACVKLGVAVVLLVFLLGSKNAPMWGAPKIVVVFLVSL